MLSRRVHVIFYPTGATVSPPTRVFATTRAGAETGSRRCEGRTIAQDVLGHASRGQFHDKVTEMGDDNQGLDTLTKSRLVDGRVQIGRDANGTVIVTGCDNNVNVTWIEGDVYSITIGGDANKSFIATLEEIGALLKLARISPFSLYPSTRRQLLSQPLIGRENELEWPQRVEGDVLLVGQPGSGKTFLLHKIATEGRALFVVSDDRDRILSAVKSECPAALIVDDAHTRTQLLTDLLQVRNETGADFSILASSWPGAASSVAETLNLPQTCILTLQPLTRDQIVEVVRGAGVEGPVELVREIVNQAEGRPGLAVTLTDLCLRGGVQDVIMGQALSRSVLDFLDAEIGTDARDILAAFAMGGDKGLSMTSVAEALGYPLPTVRAAVTQLAAGGLVLDIDGERLSVRPLVLRFVLVGETFFGGATSFPAATLEKILAECPDPGGTTLNLVGARARGATIPDHLLIELINRAASPDVLKAYAYWGPDQAAWVLDHYPETLSSIAEVALNVIPDRVLPSLLDAAVGDRRQLHSTPEHPLRLITDWIHRAQPGRGEAFPRRQRLLDALELWIDYDKDGTVVLLTLGIVFSPGFEHHWSDAGAGMTLTLQQGLVTDEEREAIVGLWPRGLEILRSIVITNWIPIQELIHSWAYPRYLNAQAPPEVAESTRVFAARMLEDLTQMAADRAGFCHWAAELAANLEQEIDVALDPEFAVLFPVGKRERIQDLKDQQLPQVHEMANRWAGHDPAVVARKLAAFELEARSTAINWPRWTPDLCRVMADQVAAPAEWTRKMIDAEVPTQLIEPFLRRAAHVTDQGWEDLCLECLESEATRWAAIEVVLTLGNPPVDLLAQVMNCLEGYSEGIKILCVRNQVNEAIVGRLLRSDDGEIAAAAAYGEWAADPQGTIREALIEDWRQAVVRSGEKDYWLEEVFRADPNLALEWLLARVNGPDLGYVSLQGAYVHAVTTIDSEGRRQVLRRISRQSGLWELIEYLVGGDLDLYAELLGNEQLAGYHLSPLARYPEGAWIKKAMLALDHGYSPEEIASACCSEVSWSGKESAMWSDWGKRFDALGSDSDARIREIGTTGSAYVTARRDAAIERERMHDVYGRQ